MLGYSQLELGSAKSTFTLNYNWWGALVTATWTTELWHFLQEIGGKLIPAAEHEWLPKGQQQRDRFLMGIAMNEPAYTRDELLQINQCCLFRY